LGIHWQRFLVAVDGAGDVIGCGQVKRHGDGSRELASIAVVPAWRRRGVATAVIVSLQQMHGPPLWLTCVEPLAPFYRRYGFRHVILPAAMPRYFRRAARFFDLYAALSRRKVKLAVMLWQNVSDDNLDQSNHNRI
jgi:amino-acid N-acetyltransferase